MIESVPWLAPVLSWVIAITLLAMVMVVAWRRETVAYQEVIAILVGSLMLALAGMTTALLSVFPRGTFDLELVGIELATLRGFASAIYLGVFMHMTDAWPSMVRFVDRLVDRIPVLHRQHKPHGKH